jgi:hypothetical protein
MGVLIVLAIAIIVIVILVRNNKRKNALEELKNTTGYAVAVELKKELESKGCKVGDLKTSFASNESVQGSFDVSDPYSGTIKFGNRTRWLTTEKHHMQLFAVSVGCPTYVIENTNISLLVSSIVWRGSISKDIPPLMEIASDVIIRNGCDFESMMI